MGRRRRRLRDVAVLAGGAGGPGDALRLGRTGRLYGVAGRARVDHSGLPRPGWSTKAQACGRAAAHQRLTMGERSAQSLEDAWQEISLAEGSQGPHDYEFSARRVRPTSRRKPGNIHWAIYRRNLDGSEPRYNLSNAPEDTPLETLAYVGGSRWRIETEFETERSEEGLDDYETRTWAGWHHYVALCLLEGAFLLSLQQAWGKKMPRITGPQAYRWCGRCCPGNGSGRMNCCGG